jgi:hypothetical protein
VLVHPHLGFADIDPPMMPQSPHWPAASVDVDRDRVGSEIVLMIPVAPARTRRQHCRAGQRPPPLRDCPARHVSSGRLRIHLARSSLGRGTAERLPTISASRSGGCTEQLGLGGSSTP